MRKQCIPGALSPPPPRLGTRLTFTLEMHWDRWGEGCYRHYRYVIIANCKGALFREKEFLQTLRGALLIEGYLLIRAAMTLTARQTCAEADHVSVP